MRRLNRYIREQLGRPEFRWDAEKISLVVLVRKGNIGAPQRRGVRRFAIVGRGRVGYPGYGGSAECGDGEAGSQPSR
jgi:hypothetical protein